MDPHATADANMATEELEKSLLVLPQQFLLVERAGMIMDENLHGNRLFTYKTQPEVWNSIRANFQAGFRKLWNYIRDVNDATTFSLSGKLKKAFQGTEPAVIKLDLQYLEQLAWTMSEAEVLGHDVAGIVAQWKSAVGDVREKLRRQFAASTGPGQAMDYGEPAFLGRRCIMLTDTHHSTSRETVCGKSLAAIRCMGRMGATCRFLRLRI